MSNSTLRDRIHQLVDNSDEEMLEAVYQLLQQTEYTDEFKNILHEEFATYQATKKVITREEVNKEVQNIMKKQ